MPSSRRIQGVGADLTLILGVKVVVNVLGKLGADARNGGNLFGTGGADVVDGAEVGQELFLAVMTEPGNFVEAGSAHAIASLLTVKRHRKPVRFVAQAA